ncbi:hypothetical protein NCR96_09020 [Helicobacter sp. 14348-15]|uniref:hypothetical protein n=1 Tax=Helicobacter colisuis TaxID=2949739 RepID=UPI00202B3D41|nr:hypothetical protein [Helicobacter colisuis]MCL9821874.1 hypothetical protein [Helicobacter colisuis]
MIVLIFFIVVAVVLYLNSQNFFDAQELLENATYIVGLSAVLIYVFLWISDFESEKNLYFLALIPLYAVSIYLIKEKTKSKPLDVIANQQRYFNEVKAKDIIKYYSVRKDVKNNRVEALVNKHSKKLIKNGVIIPQFFLNFKTIEPTKIQSIQELENSKVFSVVFKKVKGFISDLEAKVDYEKALAENGNYAEFFLMDLWEKYTYKFNISLANLDILATNLNEKELLGALDLLNLNCVKLKGAVLYYKFIQFKDRIKDFVKEEQNVNPKEEGFDEKYAKENDSDRTRYEG